MERKFRLLLRRRDRPGPMRQQIYAAEDSVDVRDLMTCVTQHVLANQLSPYRHTVILDGMEFQILNVIRQ